jgi:hypothetical protein
MQWYCHKHCCVRSRDAHIIYGVVYHVMPIYMVTVYQGTAYVDDTDPATMKEERENRQESANRSNCECFKR